MIRCILCFKNETVSRKLRSDMKMVSHLILIFGILCAGAFAASWNSGEDSDEGIDVDSEWDGFIPMSSYCNECRTTVIDMTIMARREIEMGTYDDNFYPCTNYRAKKNEICRKTLDFVKANLQFNLVDSREICAKANYCTRKNKNKPNSVPLIVYSSNSRKSHCRSGNNDDVGSTGTTDEEPSLDLSRNSVKCQECERIIDSIKAYIGDLEPQDFMYPYACAELKGSLADHCNNLVQQHGDEITTLLRSHSRTSEICIAIKECKKEKNYQFCLACQIFNALMDVFRKETETMVKVSCILYIGKWAECKSALDEHKIEMWNDHIKHPWKYPLEVCQDAGMCAKSDALFD